MPALKLTVTPAGRAALTNAVHNGTAPILLASVGLTATSFDPTTAVALPNEIKRVTTLAGGATAADTLHVTVRDNSTDTYTLRGLALYLADGTVFGFFSQVDVLLEKSAQATALLAVDVQFADIAATSLTFGDTNFQLNAATTTVAGVVQLADDPTTIAGADSARSVTPKGLLAALNDRLGSGAPSAFIKSLLTTINAAVFRTALAIKGAALFDAGANNGLDADLLDGKHGAYYQDWPNFTNVPTPATRWPVVAEVTGLQGALDTKLGIADVPSLTARGAGKSLDYLNATRTASLYWTAHDAGNWSLSTANDDGSYRTTRLIIPRASASPVLIDGAAPWTANNFNPASKADASTVVDLTSSQSIGGGKTFTYGALRVQGWGGSADSGVVYLGSLNRYIFQPSAANRMELRFSDAAYAVLDAGGTIFTSNNFDPTSKLSLSGGTMTGDLNVGARNGNGYVQAVGGSSAAAAGYIGFLTGDNVRHGYIGNSNGGWMFVTPEQGDALCLAGAVAVSNGGLAVNRGKALPAAALDVQTVNGRLLVRDSGGATTIDAVNSANSAYAPLNITASLLTRNGNTVWDESNFNPGGKLDVGANAVSATRLYGAGYSAGNDANNPGGSAPNGVQAYNFTSASANTPHSDWATLISMCPAGNGDRTMQLAYSWNYADSFAMRFVGGTWRHLWHDGNFDPTSKLSWSGGTMTGALLMSGGGGTGNGLALGNGDGASATVANVRMTSWYGIGFGPTASGMPVPSGQNSHWFDTRTGNAGFGGSLSLASLAASGAITGASIHSTGTVMAAGGFQIG